MDRFHRLDAPSFASALAETRRPFLLDVRDRPSFESGHVPGARNVFVHEIAHRGKDLPASKIARILLYADTPKRGEAAANFLSILGYADVAVLEGGFAAWGGPVETGPEAPLPVRRTGPELRVVPNTGAGGGGSAAPEPGREP